MGTIRVDAQRTMAFPAEKIYARLVDYTERRARWLPSNVTGYTLEQGGEGGGTEYHYTLKVGNREREYRMAVAVVDPGTSLIERDRGSSLTTTWTLRPGSVGHTLVLLQTQWEGHGGIGGFFERRFAPPALRRVYDDLLGRLEQEVSQP